MKKGGKRIQIKRLRFQIKQAFDLQKDPFHLLSTLQKLEAARLRILTPTI